MAYHFIALLALFFNMLLIQDAQASSVNNTTECVNAVLNHYPRIKGRMTYLPEDNLLIEELGEAPNKVIHSSTGSSYLRSKKSLLCDTINYKVFNKEPIHGIPGLLSLAIKYGAKDESKGLAFLKSLPQGCRNTVYSGADSPLNSEIKKACCTLNKKKPSHTARICNSSEFKGGKCN